MKIFKPSTLVSLGIAIAASLLTQPMRASINTLVITENSSTTLTVTLNNNPSFMVQASPADSWVINLTGVGGSGGSSNSGDEQWYEPGSADIYNHVFFDSLHPNLLGVRSEFQGNPNQGIANNTPDTTSFTLNGLALSVTFNDLGDAPTTPDAGSTLGLLALALAALFGASRFRDLRLA